MKALDRPIKLFPPRLLHGQWVTAIEIDTENGPIRVMASADENIVKAMHSFSLRALSKYVALQSGNLPRVGLSASDGGSALGTGLGGAYGGPLGAAAGGAAGRVFGNAIDTFLAGGDCKGDADMCVALKYAYSQWGHYPRTKEEVEAVLSHVKALKAARKVIDDAANGSAIAKSTIAKVSALAKGGNSGAVLVHHAMQLTLAEKKIIALARTDFPAFIRAISTLR